MSEVKRYDLVGDMDGNCNLNEARMEMSDDGVYVKHSDYAALEAKCAALVAENAGLKNPDNWLSLSDYGYEASEVATQNGATEDESLRAGIVAIINRIETTATDAFLAEVMAHGVEMLYARRAAQWDDELLAELNEFATHLREEGAA